MRKLVLDRQVLKGVIREVPWGGVFMVAFGEPLRSEPEPKQKERQQSLFSIVRSGNHPDECLGFMFPKEKGANHALFVFGSGARSSKNKRSSEQKLAEESRNKSHVPPDIPKTKNGDRPETKADRRKPPKQEETRNEDK